MRLRSLVGLELITAFHAKLGAVEKIRRIDDSRIVPLSLLAGGLASGASASGVATRSRILPTRCRSPR